MLGGPVELGGTIAEGNVYIDGNPVSIAFFKFAFQELLRSFVFRFVTTAGMQKMQWLPAG